MNKEMKEKYRKQDMPIATYCMCNWGGIEILDILYGIDDYVVWRENYGEPNKDVHCSKINHGVNHSSFRAGRYTIRLDECMRTGR